MRSERRVAVCKSKPKFARLSKLPSRGMPGTVLNSGVTCAGLAVVVKPTSTWRCTGVRPPPRKTKLVFEDRRSGRNPGNNVKLPILSQRRSPPAGCRGVVVVVTHRERNRRLEQGLGQQALSRSEDLPALPIKPWYIIGRTACEAALGCLLKADAAPAPEAAPAIQTKRAWCFLCPYAPVPELKTLEPNDELAPEPGAVPRCQDSFPAMLRFRCLRLAEVLHCRAPGSVDVPLSVPELCAGAGSEDGVVGASSSARSCMQQHPHDEQSEQCRS